MEKELNLGTIVAAYNVLEGGENVPVSIKSLGLKFSGKTAFKISLLKSKLKEYATIAEETRTNLIVEKYGEDVEGKGKVVPTEKLQDFLYEYSSVLETKHKISFTPLTLEDLDVEGVPVEFTDIIVEFVDIA